MAEIPLGRSGRVALVDDSDVALVSQYRWYSTCTRWPYAQRYWWVDGRRRTQFMHNLIMGFKGVDHIDANGLNNQRSNLRPATQAQNEANARKTRSVTTSQYKGVFWHSQRHKWCAQIKTDGRSCHLGLFVDEVAAARAYDAAAREAWGEYALLNFPG